VVLGKSIEEHLWYSDYGNSREEFNDGTHLAF